MHEAADDLGPSKWDVLHWLDSMGSLEQGSLNRIKHMGNFTRNMRCYDLEYLVRCIYLCTNLRGDARLVDVVDEVGALLGMEPGWVTSSTDGAIMPSRSHICGMRFSVDAGFCLLMRQWWDKLLALAESGVDFIICLLADSSPRVGKDWLLSEVFVCTDDEIAEFLETQGKLKALLQSDPVDWPAVQALEEQLKTYMRHHVLIPVANGVGNSSLSCKWAGLIHQFRIEARTWTMVSQILKRALCVTADFGTESGLALVPNINPNKLWPHWNEEDEPQLVDDSGFADIAMPPAPESRLVSFESAMSVPGTEHICHNCFQHVTNTMSGFQSWLKKAKAVAKMFTDSMYKERFCERCIPQAHMQKARERVMGQIRDPPDHRFLGVIEFLEDFLPLKNIVKENFTESRMFGKKSSKDDSDGPRKTSAREEQWIDQGLVSAALTSDAWWSYAVMVEAVGHAPEHIVYFSRACACHKFAEPDETFEDAMSFTRTMRRRGRKLFSRPCMGKGLCAPAFATGAAVRVIDKTYADLRILLMRDFRNLSRAESSVIFSDVEKQSHMSALNCKLSCRSGSSFLYFWLRWGKMIACWLGNICRWLSSSTRTEPFLHGIVLSLMNTCHRQAQYDSTLTISSKPTTCRLCS